MFWNVLIISVITIPLVLLVLFVMGMTNGEEFSPDDFSRRSFYYNRVPLLKWTVIGKQYSDTTSDLEQTLLADGLIPPTANKTKVWHLSSDTAGTFDGYLTYECDARFLTEYLDLLDSNASPYWIAWNSKYPDTAKVFWPLVADLARHEMYLAVPDIMRYAMSVESDEEPEKFEDRLNELVANAYLDLGEIDLTADRLSRASDRLTRSIELVPSPEAYQLRADVFESLGQQTRATDDRDAAEKFTSAEE
jgi:tetratricopeptide (TPR) repeat protein